jgi:hypothetical protein
VLLELGATPFARLEQWRDSDIHVYDDWARTIAAGDWLSATVRVPMHSWHRGVARQYFEEHPDARASIEREAASQGRDPDELLWARWMHVPQFYQDPLYPYLVALTYRTLPEPVPSTSLSGRRSSACCRSCSSGLSRGAISASSPG